MKKLADSPGNINPGEDRVSRSHRKLGNLAVTFCCIHLRSTQDNEQPVSRPEVSEATHCVLLQQGIEIVDRLVMGDCQISLGAAFGTQFPHIQLGKSTSVA